MSSSRINLNPAVANVRLMQGETDAMRRPPARPLLFSADLLSDAHGLGRQLGLPVHRRLSRNCMARSRRVVMMHVLLRGESLMYQ